MKKINAKPPSCREREKCLGCGEPMPINVIRKRDDIKNYAIDRVLAGLDRDRGPIIKWRYAGFGHFCTQNCAVYFANKIVSMGILDHINVPIRSKPI